MLQVERRRRVWSTKFAASEGVLSLIGHGEEVDSPSLSLPPRFAHIMTAGGSNSVVYSSAMAFRGEPTNVVNCGGLWLTINPDGGTVIGVDATIRSGTVNIGTGAKDEAGSAVFGNVGAGVTGSTGTAVNVATFPVGQEVVLGTGGMTFSNSISANFIPRVIKLATSEATAQIVAKAPTVELDQTRLLLSLLSLWNEEDADKPDPNFENDRREFEANRVKFLEPR
jgi:hypothetical protein